MERLTINKNVSEIGMYELAHNACYIKDSVARYRDFEMDMDARDFTRNLMTTLANEDMSLDDDLFDEEIIENLMYDPFSDIRGLIALFYRNLWAMADLREKLKEYEDAEEQGLLSRLPCKVGDTIYCVDDIRKFVDECKVTKLECRSVAKNHFGMSVELTGKLWHCISSGLIGKVAFFTKEEAEQAFAEMKGE